MHLFPVLLYVTDGMYIMIPRPQKSIQHPPDYSFHRHAPPGSVCWETWMPYAPIVNHSIHDPESISARWQRGDSECSLFPRDFVRPRLNIPRRSIHAHFRYLSIDATINPSYSSWKCMLLLWPRSGCHAHISPSRGALLVGAGLIPLKRLTNSKIGCIASSMYRIHRHCSRHNSVSRHTSHLRAWT